GRQDAGWNGAAKGVEFALSDSAETFGDPLAKTELAKSKEPQSIACLPTKGRYVLFRVLSEQSDNAFASAAEIGVLGE
ncbi:MAG: hypothetical protein KDM63_22735, partial [Verrucomicrobiae bacterium]|nr:hypothetical protein [Verrucomicrobiae bacterium]